MAWRLLLEVIQVDVNIHREIQIICRLEKLERNDPKPKNNCYRWESCFLLYQIVLRYLINSMGLNRSNRNSDVCSKYTFIVHLEVVLRGTDET